MSCRVGVGWARAGLEQKRKARLSSKRKGAGEGNQSLGQDSEALDLLAEGMGRRPKTWQGHLGTALPAVAGLTSLGYGPALLPSPLPFPPGVSPGAWQLRGRLANSALRQNFLP